MVELADFAVVVVTLVDVLDVLDVLDPGLVVVVVLVVLDVLDVGGGTVVVVTPVGSTMRNWEIAFTATAGGRGIAVPLGKKAIVINWPSRNRSCGAAPADTIVPLLALGEAHHSTDRTPGFWFPFGPQS